MNNEFYCLLTYICDGIQNNDDLGVHIQLEVTDGHESLEREEKLEMKPLMHIKDYSRII